MSNSEPTSEPVADQRLQALLDRYGRPLPFHAARAQLLGAIVSPTGASTARDILASLWGKEAPPFAKADVPDAEIDVVLGEVADQLRKSLAANQPFRLTPIDAEPSRESLSRLALVRREEIDTFIAGLFGTQEVVELTKPAFAALDSMSNIRSLVQELRSFLDDPGRKTTPAGLAASLRSVEDLQPPLEEAINTVVRQCVALRRHANRRKQQEGPGPGRSLGRRYRA